MSIRPADACPTRCHRIGKCREILVSERIHEHLRLYAAPDARPDPEDMTTHTMQSEQIITSMKGTMDSGVHATVVTAGHCTQAELTSGHALASC